MGAAVPAVEITDDRHGLGIGGPKGETRTLDAVDDNRMGPELLVEFEMTAFFKEVNVVIGKHRGIIVCPARCFNLICP